MDVGRRDVEGVGEGVGEGVEDGVADGVIDGVGDVEGVAEIDGVGEGIVTEARESRGVHGGSFVRLQVRAISFVPMIEAAISSAETDIGKESR